MATVGIEDFERSEAPVENSRFSFFGEGAKYFGIIVVNYLLTLVTLGLYYPWAKAAVRKYLWNETELRRSRFVFHGTGKEMFRGFVIAYIVFGSLILLTFSNILGVYGIFFFYLAMIFLYPVAYYSGWRYRISRTSWRGIFFSFDGKFSEFLKIFGVQILLTIITFGIYYAWMRVKLQKYLFEHTKFGQYRLDFHGEGGTLFGIDILGGLLMYPTLFLIVPHWIKERFNFTIRNTTITDGEIRKRLISTLDNKKTYKVLLTNFLLLVVTLGLAFPWTIMRRLKMQFESIEVSNMVDLDKIDQGELNDYRDATGDELLDVFDLDLDF